MGLIWGAGHQNAALVKMTGHFQLLNSEGKRAGGNTERQERYWAQMVVSSGETQRSRFIGGSVTWGYNSPGTNSCGSEPGRMGEECLRP